MIRQKTAAVPTPQGLSASSIGAKHLVISLICGFKTFMRESVFTFFLKGKKAERLFAQGGIT